jgi:hypothetical protein
MTRCQSDLNSIPLPSDGFLFDQFIFLLHCDEWDRFVVPPRQKFVTEATLLQLEWQIRCFPYGERSDIPWLQQVKQKRL